MDKATVEQYKKAVAQARLDYEDDLRKMNNGDLFYLAIQYNQENMWTFHAEITLKVLRERLKEWINEK